MADSLFSQSISFLLFLAGAILLVAEAFAPGAHLFVLGVALLSAGLVGLFLPGGLGIFAPIILGVVVLGVTALTLWGYRKVDLYGGEGAAETSHSGSLRGQFGRVTERVTTSSGTVRLDDGGFNPNYQARSVDGEIEVGTEVMVVDPGGGNVVTVEPVASRDDIDRELARERGQTETARDANASGTDRVDVGAESTDDETDATDDETDATDAETDDETDAESSDAESTDSDATRERDVESDQAS